MSYIITKNNYIKYDVSETFDVYKARDIIPLNNNMVIDNTKGEQTENVNNTIQLNDYGRTVNAINYAAIKYLTDKYDFIRSSFVDIRGNWATKLVDATNNTDKHKRCPVLIIDMISFQLYNMPQLINEEEEILFVNAIDDLMMLFNGMTKIHDTPKSSIIINKIRVEFNIKTISGKTYYYIDNLFMVDDNSNYSWNTKHPDYKASTPQTNNIDLSTYRDTTYDTVYTGLQAPKRNITATGITHNSKPTPDRREFSASGTVFTMLTQVPGVLDANGNICKSIADKALYKQNKLEQYITDANITTGYKLFWH